MDCPLCRHEAAEFFCDMEVRRYFRCRYCQLRFLDPARHLSASDEVAHYRSHQNVVGEEGYERFLGKLTIPLLAKLENNLSGLDFGCGPGPALAQMMEKAGHAMALYDPYFYTEPSVLEGRFDFITSTEAVEHFHNPMKEFLLFNALLKPGGWLGIMTCFQTADDEFANWHYRRDPTHVLFFRPQTFEWLAGQFGWSCEFAGKDVVLMQKQS